MDPQDLLIDVILEISETHPRIAGEFMRLIAAEDKEAVWKALSRYLFFVRKMDPTESELIAVLLVALHFKG